MWLNYLFYQRLSESDCAKAGAEQQIRARRRSSADAEDDHRVGLRPAPIALRCLTCSVGPTYDLRWSPLGRAPSSGNVSQPRDCFFTGWQVSCSGCQRCFQWQPSMHHNSLWYRQPAAPSRLHGKSGGPSFSRPCSSSRKRGPKRQLQELCVAA